MYSLKADDLHPLSRLLENNKLNADDLTPDHLQHFFGIRVMDELAAAGGIEIHGHYGLLRSLVTHPRHRGKGLANAMVKQLEQYATERGIQKLYLLTETAEHYFAKCGYATQARSNVPSAIAATTQFSDLCPDSATLMSKTLSASSE